MQKINLVCCFIGHYLHWKVGSVQNCLGIFSMNILNVLLVEHKKVQNSLVVDFFSSKTWVIQAKMDLRTFVFKKILFLLAHVLESKS